MATDPDTAYRGRPVCVTGGAGFIGSHLVEALAGLGARVTVVDDCSTGTPDNLAAVREDVRFVEGSILDPAALGDALGDAELVFHQAAATSVPASVEDPARYHEVNATGTLRVLEAARAAGRGVRVVNASSSSVYGDRGGGAVDETLDRRPQSPYAASKCAGELLLRAFCACYDLDGISLRYFNVFGPRQRPDSPYAAVIPTFARAMLHGERPVIFGDGTQSRDFSHVANAVRGNLLAGAVEGPLSGAPVNIACGAGCTIIELVEKMAAILGVEPGYELAPPRPGDILHSRADITRAGVLLGYEPVMSLDEGLRDALAYYKGHGPQ